MSYVIAAPEIMSSAASDLAAIGSYVSAAHLAAAPRTVAVVPAAADEVSAAIASVFADHAQAFQRLAAKAAVFHDQFAQTLTSGGAAYAQAEAASAVSLLSLVPTGIQTDLLAAYADAAVLLILGIFFVPLVFGYLVYTLVLDPLGWS